MPSPAPCDEETSVRAVSQRRSPWKWLELVTKALKSFSQGKEKEKQQKEDRNKQRETYQETRRTLAMHRDWLSERARRHADEDGLKRMRWTDETETYWDKEAGRQSWRRVGIERQRGEADFLPLPGVSPGHIKHCWCDTNMSTRHLFCAF